MHLKLFNSIAVSLFLILAVDASAWPQSVILEGRMVDADGPPLAGVAISVHSATTCQTQTLESTISLADGTYKLSGVKASSSILVCYGRIGYMPDPLPKSVTTVSSGTQAIPDVPLVQNGSNAGYWQVFAAETKARIDLEIADPSQQALRYEAVWRALQR